MSSSIIAPQKRDFKSKWRKQRRRTYQVIEDLQNQIEQLKKSNSRPAIYESSESISHESSDQSRFLVSKSLWQALTPSAKRKAKSSLASKKLSRLLK